MSQQKETKATQSERSEHTPMPLFIVPKDPRDSVEPYLIGIDQFIVGHVNRKEDAEFIVRAVNEREALLTDNERLKKANEALLETCKAIVLDLENNGEIYGTDEKRIEILNEAIAQAEGKGE